MSISLKDIKKVVANYEKSNSYYAIINYLEQIEFNPKAELFVKSKLGQAYTHSQNTYNNDYQKGKELLHWVDDKEQGKNAVTQYHLAYAYFHLNAFDKSLDYANKGIRLDEKYISNYYIRGKYFEKIWYYTGAEEDFAKAEKEFQTYHKLSNDKDKEALLWLAELYYKKIDEKYDEELYLEAKSLLREYKKERDYAWVAENVTRQLQALRTASQQPQELISVPSYISDWYVYSDNIYQMPCQIKVDKGLKTLLPLNDFQEQIWIAVSSQYTSSDGLFPDIEHNIMKEMELAFSKKLGTYQAIYAGYLQRNGVIEFIFYSNPIKHLERRLDQVMFHFKEYNFDWEVNTASVWLDYTDLMLPESLISPAS